MIVPIPPEEPLLPLSTVDRVRLFGAFAFVPAPRPDDPEAIRMTDGWAHDNVVSVHVPQLRGVVGAPASCRVPWHRLATPQLLGLWQAWERAGLLPLVLSWAGSWCPRFVRGSTSRLSSHAWATALDVNAPQNMRGRPPAPLGSRGSVLELLPLAERWGFAWGGHFGVSDPMHLEVAKLDARG